LLFSGHGFEKLTEVDIFFLILILVVFQSVFHAEMHQNNIFFIFKKIIFKISASKRFKTLKKLFFSKNKFEFFGNTG
jgi:flagellar biosynthesis protein FlhB